MADKAGRVVVHGAVGSRSMFVGSDEGNTGEDEQAAADLYGMQLLAEDEPGAQAREQDFA